MPAFSDVLLDKTITELFDGVFFEGAGAHNSEVPFPYPVSIAGRAFTLDLAHYSWELPDMMRQAVDYSARPGEQSFDTGGVWLRSEGDWSMGSGQNYSDSARSNERRYGTSLGINPWEMREISLLPETVKILDLGNGAQRLLSAGAQDYLYVMDGAFPELGRTANPESDTPTFELITGPTGTAYRDLTTDGNEMFLATDDGIFRHDVSGAATATAYGGAASTTAVDILEYANGWLLAGIGNRLVSIDAAGALVTVMQHPVDTFTWTAISGSPGAIYIGGQADDTGVIYRVGIDEGTGGLAVPIFSGALPRGEDLETMQSYAASLLLGTSKGLRLAQIQGNGTLSVGPVIATDWPVVASDVEAEFVWYSLTDYDSTHTGVGRAKLSEFTAQGFPAYATDLMAENTSGAVRAICRHQGKTYFAVNADGLYHEKADGSLVATGSLSTGRFEWSTFVPKSFLGVELITAPLTGQVRASLEDDDGNDTFLGALTIPGSTNLGTLLGAGFGVQSTAFTIDLELDRDADDPTLGPVVRLLTSRALPIPRQVQRWILPIICDEHILVGANNDVERSQDVSAVRDWFVSLRQSGRAVPYIEGSRRYLVVVRRVAFSDQEVQRWATGRQGLQGTLMVQIDSVEG